MKKSIIYRILIIFLFLIILLFQIFIINSNSLFGIKPNLILVFLIVYSLFTNFYKTCIISTLIGMLMDIIFGNSNFIFLIAYTFSGIVLASINEKYTKENKMTIVMLSVISVVCFEIIEFIEYAYLYNVYANIFYLLKQILISIFLNLILCKIIYNLIYFINENLDLKFKKYVRGL